MVKERLSRFIHSAGELDHRIYYALIVVVVLALPLGLRHNTYYLRIGVLVLLYFGLALGYNTIVTTAGLFDLGYTAYFAVGAYASALLLLNTGISFWVILPVSILLTVIYVGLVSVPILRFKGDYLCIITLAFAEIVKLVAKNWLAVTRGPLGLPGIPDPKIFGITLNSLAFYYYLAALLAGIAFILVNRLTHSAVGLRWSSVKENPDAAESVGINTHRAKVSVYVVGAGLAGAVGAVFAPFQGIVDPSVAHLDNTVLILTMVILGGGSNAGLLASAAVLTIAPELMRSLATYRLLALGVFFVVVMNLRPSGFRFGVLRHFVLPQWDKKEDEAEAEGSPVLGEDLRQATATTGAIGQAVLRGASVSKHFGGLHAVDEVDFELREGEILGIIGPNGAGKTTLFNMIAGTYPPTAGKIYLGDTDITGWKPHQVALRQVARTFQIVNILPNLTVLDNVILACLPHSSRKNGSDAPLRRAWQGAYGGTSRQSTEQNITRALAAIAYVGLSGQESQVARNLPFGDRRRLELARALAMEPTILLMDEPASGMNPQEVEELMDLICRIRENGVSILLIEHNMKVAMQLSDRMIVLDHGVKIAEGTSEEIQRNEQVIEAYLGGGGEGAAD